jgi:hypothetical protein
MLCPTFPAVLLPRLVGMPAEQRWAIGELISTPMRHDFYATRSSYVPVRPQAKAADLLAVKLVRSPLWDWPAVAQARLADREASVQVQLTGGRMVRSVSLVPWQLDALELWDGTHRGHEFCLISNIAPQTVAAFAEAAVEGGLLLVGTTA